MSATPMRDPQEPPQRCQPDVPTLDALHSAAAAIVSALAEGSGRHAERRAEIAHLVARLDTDRFQLAVVGQFKRGKSTLVNALAGCPILATGILPLTQSPTFLARSEGLSLAIVEDGRTIASEAPGSVERLAALVAEATTGLRDGAGARRVEVGLPNPSSRLAHPSLLDALVLIDTPGIGSTQRRSSEVALAALPECDAALFVTSIDPPITEAEVDYLAAVAGQTKAVVFALNKIDLLEDEERAALVGFTRDAVAGIVGPGAAIFALSAKAALRARMSGDAEDLERSGLAALEAHVRATLLPRREDLLQRAVAQRLLAIAAETRHDAGFERRALLMPIDELDRTIASLGEAQGRLVAERATLQDGFAGEWRRALAALEASCTRMEAGIAVEFAELFARYPEQPLQPDVVERRFAASFAAAFAAVVAEVNASIRDAAERHRARWAALDASVRRLAGDIAGIDLPTTPDVDVDEAAPSFTPFWIGPAEIDSLGSLAADAASRFLPVRLRRARQRRRLGEALEKASRRNATQLHWAAKQAIDDAYRTLLARAPDAVDASLDAARKITVAAHGRRQAGEASSHEETGRLTAAIDALDEACRTLRGDD